MAQGADSHRQYEDLAVAHVLGGLDDADSRLFRTHLLGCDDCRARVGELRAIANELADVERDEQRTRAAQPLETKKRGDEDGAEPVVVRRGGARVPRLLVAVALVLVVGLSLWNFTLRGTVTQLQDNMDRQAEAAALLEFGVPGLVLTQAPGVDARVKVDDRRMAMLVDGLEDAALYAVYVQDASGRVLFRIPGQAADGRVLALVNLPEGAHTLLVTRPVAEMTTDPTGTTMLHVRLPAGG